MTNENQLELPATTAQALPELAPEEVRGFMLAAIEKGGIEAVERVAALYERAQERAAARAYHDALARFASKMKPIKKNAVAQIVTKGGSSYSYSYAPLDDIVRAIAEPLRDAGLTYTWDSEVTQGQITITCIVRHSDGHSATAKFTCPTESSAGMSAQQKVAAALTFGRRQSLIQALGLTSTDQDDDGADPEAGETVTTNQVLDLEVMLKDSGADKVRFLKYMGVSRIEDIPASRYAEAVSALEEKARRK